MAAPRSGEVRVHVEGRVLDASGGPVPGIVVIAVDQASGAFAGTGVSGEDGTVTISLPMRRHLFAIMSASYSIVRMTPRTPETFDLQVEKLPPDLDGSVPEEPGVEMRLGRPGIVRVEIADETGAPLEGVRLQALRGSGQAAAVAFSDSRGEVRLALLGGTFHLRPTAPGFVMTKATRAGDSVVFVMGLDVEPQALVVLDPTGGSHRLRFRIDDSIDPEFVPPPQVRAWLRFAWGTDPMARCRRIPLSVCKRRARLPPYWWLAHLRQTPPNPATLVSEEEASQPGPP